MRQQARIYSACDFPWTSFPGPRTETFEPFLPLPFETKPLDKYTVTSLDAGKFRSLADSVRIRVANKACRDMTLQLMEVLKSDNEVPEQDRWLSWYHGAAYVCSESSVANAIQTWRQMKGHCMPSLHIFEAQKIVLVIATSGCLMRPLDSFYHVRGVTVPEDQIWLVSKVWHDPDLRRSLGLDARTSPPKYYEVLRSLALLGPYGIYNSPPRPSLGTMMWGQAISVPYTSVVSRSAPRVCIPPVVVTPLAQAFTHHTDTAHNMQSLILGQTPRHPDTAHSTQSLSLASNKAHLLSHAVSKEYRSKLWLIVTGEADHPSSIDVSLSPTNMLPLTRHIHGYLDASRLQALITPTVGTLSEIIKAMQVHLSPGGGIGNLMRHQRMKPTCQYLHKR